MSHDLKFLNALNSIPGIGPATLRTLKGHFENYENAWRAEEGALNEAGLSNSAIQKILWKRPSLNPDRELQKLAKEDIALVNEEDEKYPAPLREIPNPPVALYIRGSQLKKNAPHLGIVGTRRPTSYGREVVAKIARELAEAGITVVSGLATGIDAGAHEATLDAGGVTVAVLGCGVDQASIFPPENRGLARRISESAGSLISEYAPGTPAVKEHFPARNRIISGLSLGVVVVEAREKSGALITARLALEQNREVFAIPGSIFSPTSHGPNLLIQEGAKSITSTKDILDELGIEYNEKTGEAADGLLGENERLLLQILEEPMGVDAIKQKVGLETAAIVASLSILELKGRVRNLGPDTYQKAI